MFSFFLEYVRSEIPVSNRSQVQTIGVFVLIALVNTLVFGYGAVAGSTLQPVTAQTRLSDEELDFQLALATALSQQRAEPDAPFYYNEVGRTTDLAAGGAVVYAEVRSTATDDLFPGLIEAIIAVRRGGVWDVRLPGDPGYVAARNELPPTVLADFDFTPYKIQADPAISAQQVLTDYKLPYEDANWGTVTRSYNIHGTGQIDFDLSNPNVAAAKDGRIIYANDTYNLTAFNAGAWWYWNIIVIQHGDHEYSLYGHLAPDSIPAWITDQCSDDTSQLNCDIPVRAGQVIAQEGNTGYSSNPHLHVEFGQQFGLVPYPDTQDHDGDGDRREWIYTGYVYAEHNIAFAGYSPEDVANWPYGLLQQASHGATPPEYFNIVRNADFSAGTDQWQPSGQISWAVENGMVYFLRLNTADPPQWAAFRQDTHYGAPANFPLQVALDLGNSSGVGKTITVTVLNSQGSDYGAFRCEFALPPSAPLQRYIVRGATSSTWANIRLQINVNPPDSAYAAIADNIVMQYDPDWPGGDTQCITP